MEPNERLPTIVLIGASVRALAFSAVRAGWRPVCFDLFADRDLRACAEAHRVARTDYPGGLGMLADRLAGRPWMYTGGLENHPDVVNQLAHSGPLWGNSGDTLRQVRDPVRVHDVLKRAGLDAPSVALSTDGIPADGTWLQKPIAGAGGIGICPWTGGKARQRGYFQQRIEGIAHSAVYVAGQSTAALLGVTRQLVGAAALAAPSFHYCGSIGPVECAPAIVAQLEHLGNELSQAFGLVGIFGVDFVLAGQTVWVIEVNPRYPASMEVLELACGINAVALQQDAVAGALAPTCVRQMTPPRIVAKGILYASQRCKLRAAQPRDTQIFRPDGKLTDGPALADVPEPNTYFAPGDPVLTILESVGDAAEGYETLGTAAAKFRRDSLDYTVADNRAGTLLRNAYRLRCPVCKEGKIFRGWLTVLEECPSCHVRLDRQGGDFLGSIYFNYAATGIPVIAGYLIGRLVFELPDIWLLVGLLSFAVIFPLYYLRYARSLWLAFDQFFDPRYPAGGADVEPTGS